ncbi:MAG: hypothetical protein NTX14_03815 [Candidatus Nealsonbacteria bacterium]|nr:hypothetical protein [Candidatus Nealsonbacteria bacterium]
MIEKLPKKKFWELYHKLPVALQDALFSDEIGENIIDICTRYDSLDSLDLLLDGIREVLLGILPPNEFLADLEKNLKTEETTTRRIIHEINRFVLFPVKAELENIYSLQMTPLAGAPSVNASPKSTYQEPVE